MSQNNGFVLLQAQARVKVLLEQIARQRLNVYFPVGLGDDEIMSYGTFQLC